MGTLNNATTVKDTCNTQMKFKKKKAAHKMMAGLE